MGGRQKKKTGPDLRPDEFCTLTVYEANMWEPEVEIWNQISGKYDGLEREPVGSLGMEPGFLVLD